MSIDWTRPEYDESLPEWTRIKNVTESKNVQQYLRELNPNDKSTENKDRNKQYKDNAIFYAVSGYTARGLTATPFRKPPMFDPPSGLEYLIENADGAGVGIYQQSRSVLADTIRLGRDGLFVSFPPGDGTESKSDDEYRFATIHQISALSVINWRTRTIGARSVLELIVIKTIEQRANGYEIEEVPVIRELWLDEDNLFVDTKWEQTGKDSQWVKVSDAFPNDATGARLSYIPFTFIGSENNDVEPDLPPMKDLVGINIGHYRNSADYEDSVFYAGQAQPWLSGADAAFLKEMENEGFYIGSRYLMPVPEGGQFGFASADPNPMVLEAMREKISLMIGMGARFIEPGGAAKTATEAEGDNQVQHSILSLVVSNVSEAYTKALGWAAAYMGISDELTYEINQDFTRASADPQEIAQMVGSWLQGVMPSSDIWAYFQRNGFIDPEKTIEEIDQELSERTLNPEAL